MTVPEACRDPILGRYALRRLKLPVKGGCLSIVCPRSMDDLVARLDDAEFRRRRERLPYWADVWASSVALARRLRRGPELTGKRVLDLGCGVGVAGAAACSQGADVELADFEHDALAFARFNAARNARNDSAAERRPRVTVRQFDWLCDELDERYDLILAADLVYEARDHAPLLALLARLLRHGGSAWIADPGREPSDAFFAVLGERFAVETVTEDTWFRDRRITVRIAIVGAGGE